MSQITYEQVAGTLKQTQALRTEIEEAFAEDLRVYVKARGFDVKFYVICLVDEAGKLKVTLVTNTKLGDVVEAEIYDHISLSLHNRRNEPAVLKSVRFRVRPKADSALFK